ncbi:MAG: LysR family transcriptional regulator [Pseudomonadota bacterium]
MLKYTFKQLRYVEAAGRLGSISSAAAELAISQSSITAAIDAVEGELGYDLFIRTPARGIRPTPQGTQALNRIRVFIQQSQHFEAEMQSMSGDLSGAIRIACYGTAAPAVLPPILRGMTKVYPDMSFSVLEGSIARVIECLNKGEADLAFCYRSALESTHDFVPLFDAPPFAIVPRGDPLADLASVSLSALSQRGLITLDLPGAREYFGAMFDASGLSPKVTHSTRSSEILRALVGIGFGVSILNIRPMDYHPEESDYVIVPIKDAIQPPTFGIITISSVAQPRLVSAFIKSCNDLKKRGIFKNLTV